MRVAPTILLRSGLRAQAPSVRKPVSAQAAWARPATDDADSGCVTTTERGAKPPSPTWVRHSIQRGSNHSGFGGMTPGLEVLMLPDVYLALMRHMEWADATVWRVVLASPRVQSDERIRDCLYHLHTVQWAYLRIWRDEAPEVPDVSSFRDMPAIQAWGREYHRQVVEQLDALSEEGCERLIRFPWAEQLVDRFGSPAPATFADTILQITSHSTYHRGQINMRLRGIGAEPPLTDYIAWVWMQRPEAEW